MNELSTAGIKIKYAVESTAGTKPSQASDYTEITNVKNIDGVEAEPSQYEVTDLSDTKFKRYIPGLFDMGGNIDLTVNLTSAFKTAWETLVTAAQTGAAANKATWFEIVIPGMSDAFWFKGIPLDLALPNIAVDSVLEGHAYITPNSISGWAAKV